MADFALTFADGADEYTFTAVQTLRAGADAVTDTSRVPGASGGFDHYGSDPAPDAIKSVRVTFVLRTYSRDDMQAKLDALLALYDLGVRKLYHQPQGSAAQRWAYARVDNISTPRRPAEHSDLRQPVTVIFQLNPPFWYEAEESADINASGTSTDGTVTNDGNANAIPRLTVACGAGQTITNPTIQRIVDGTAVDEVSYTGVLTATDELIIDCDAKTALLNDSSVLGDISRSGADWFRLRPGSNTVRVTASNGGDAATVTVAHKNTYRG